MLKPQSIFNLWCLFKLIKINVKAFYWIPLIAGLSRDYETTKSKERALYDKVAESPTEMIILVMITRVR